MKQLSVTMKEGVGMTKYWKVLLLIGLLFASSGILKASDPSWIWFPDAGGIKGESRYFRTVFNLEEIPYSLLARIVANHETTVYINGERMRTIYPEEILGSIELADSLKSGTNVLAIKVSASIDQEIQPLLVRVVDIDNDVVFGTDNTWRAANRECLGWEKADFDDSNWAQVLCSGTMQKPEITSSELIKMMGEFAPEKDATVLENASIWLSHSAQYIFTTDTATKDCTVKALTGTNQTASMQLAVRSNEPINPLEIGFTDLTNKDTGNVISKEHFKYNFIETWNMTQNSTQTPKALLIEAPKDMPDILSEKRVVNIPKDYTKAVYLQFFVPKDTPEGIYLGNVILENLGVKREVPIEIEVLPVSLPDETNLKVTIWFQPNYIVTHNKVIKYSEEFWQIIDYYAKKMAEHRQNMVWTPLDLFSLRYNDKGELTGDFTDFDRWIETFFKEGFKYIELSHIGARVGERNSDFAYIKRQAYDVNLKTTREVPLGEYMHLIQEHLREKGWLEVSYAHVADEPTTYNYSSWIELAREIRRQAPDLKLMEALHYTDLSDYLDVAIPQLDYFDQNKNRLLKEQEDGKIELWFYTCWLPQGNYPNRLLDYPLYKTRILHWANFLYDAPGYLHWGYNWWNAFEVGFAPGDGWIVYPTENSIVSSMRYEAMREGIEDYEYLLLHAKKTQEIAKELNVTIDEKYRAKEITGSVMRSLTNYTDDPLELYKARERLLREIVELDRGPKALLVTSLDENSPLNGDTVVSLQLYTEKGSTVTLNGDVLEETSPGSYETSVLLTPDNPKIVLEVALNGQIKTLERIYSNWRIIK